ncbi:MAG: polysaccharide biosynthesis protein [Deltaproteobacteria bacterium]|nr:polysaccharide biosynthesis protein [Deltaproteobacteria bacterium]
MTLQEHLYRNFLLVFVLDLLLVVFSWYFTHQLRFNFNVPPDQAAVMFRLLPFVLCVKIITFFFFNLYRGMWRYTSLRDILGIMKAATVSSLVIVFVIALIHGFAGYARSTFVIDWILTVLLIAGSRAGIRLLVWIGMKDSTANIHSLRLFGFLGGREKGGKRLIIIGAGDCGEKIYREIQDNAALRYRVMGFVDDDPSKIGKQIHGVPVLGATSNLQFIASRVKPDELLIAIPSAGASHMRSIVDRCKECGVPFKTLPGMGELINGKVSVKAIRDVAYRDLLGREVVQLEEDRVRGYLTGARVLVTGAGGSIGSELCRQICRFNPESLILYERAESPLYEIDLELRTSFPGVRVVAVLGDIRDRHQLSHAFNRDRPQVVFHSAAYKHVPMMELHPWKAVRNNVLGTRNLIDVSQEHKVERFVLISTDKAVRPINVMGASKRVAELLVQNQNGCGATDSRFMTVRFGNVIGSVGSVVPLFRRQIEKGGPVTVTHPDMTRYFMTIPEACQLILQAGAMGEGGEIFILDMGTPIKIADMARDLIRLSGFEPDVDIQVEYVGLRPGEKLFEELITEGEGIQPTRHTKIMVLRGKSCDAALLNGAINELAHLAYKQDSSGIRAKLEEIVPEFMPWEG